jgi:hypothetical protein
MPGASHIILPTQPRLGQVQLCPQFTDHPGVSEHSLFRKNFIVLRVGEGQEGDMVATLAGGRITVSHPSAVSPTGLKEREVAELVLPGKARGRWRQLQHQPPGLSSKAAHLAGCGRLDATLTEEHFPQPGYASPRRVRDLAAGGRKAGNTPKGQPAAGVQTQVHPVSKPGMPPETASPPPPPLDSSLPLTCGRPPLDSSLPLTCGSAPARPGQPLSTCKRTTWDSGNASQFQHPLKQKFLRPRRKSHHH